MITKDFITGLDILKSYLKLDEYDIACGNDQFWIGHDITVAEGDEVRLKELGWFWDDDVDSWSAYI